MKQGKDILEMQEIVEFNQKNGKFVGTGVKSGTIHSSFGIDNELIDKKNNSILNETTKDVKLKNVFEVHFWELSDRVRCNLDAVFLKVLFHKAGKGDLHQLASKLGISYSYVSPLVRGVYSIPKNLLLKLAQEGGTSLEEVESHIVSIRTRHGHICKIKFPIFPSKQMASLVGHVFGDGYIGRRKRQFEYCNNNSNLLEEVKEHTKEIFGLEPFTERWNRIGYSSIVGEILEKFGAHVAPKIKSEKSIPEWIKLGPEDFKIAFIRALFDDDGSVLFSENYNAKGVNLYQIREKRLLGQSHNLLLEIKKMLHELGIYSGEPHLRKFYLSNGEERAISYINITNYNSIFIFYRKIGLSKGDKLNRLMKIIDKYGGKCVTSKKPKKVLVLGSGALRIS